MELYNIAACDHRFQLTFELNTLRACLSLPLTIGNVLIKVQESMLMNTK